MSFRAADSSASSEPGSSYVVVARRYRPRAFDDLVGQQHVSRALRNAIETNRVGHAYLFTGARGVGKTSTARIFAKALNAPEGPTPHPDCDSDVCRAIEAGEDVDVIEIDGASNRGIDEIRQLRANVNVRPSRSRFKIYIIDEVHMLTTAAFNALLKTLEEPPEHVKFIFCTTDPQKIPITVLSRCQRFDFAPVDPRAICERLVHIVDAEGRTAEMAALQLLARRAEGSMRDSQSLLEQLLAFADGEIRVEHVHEMLGTASSSYLSGLTERIVAHDAAGALGQLDQAVGDGVDCGQLSEQLLGYFRDLLAMSVNCPADLLRHCGPGDHETLAQLSGQLGTETILAMTQILDQTLVRMRQSMQPRILVEIALVRMCRLEDLDSLTELVDRLASGAAAAPVRSSGRSAAPPAQRSAAGPGTASGGSKSGTPPGAGGPGAEKKTLQPEPTPPAAHVKAHVPTAWDVETATAVWKQAIDVLEDMTADMASFFDHVAISAPDSMVVYFAARYTLQKDACEQPDRRKKLETALAQIAGRPIRLSLAGMPAGPESSQDVRPKAVSMRQLMRERESHPWVRQAIELFDAEVTRVELLRRDVPPGRAS